MVNRSHMLSQKRPSFNKNSPPKKNERTKTKGKTLFQFRCNEFIWVRFAKSQRSQDRHEWLPGCVDHSRPTTNPKIVEVFPWPPPGCVSDVWRGEGFYLNHLPTSYASFLKRFCGFLFPKTAKTVQDVQTDCWEPRIWCTWNEFSCHHSPLDSVKKAMIHLSGWGWKNMTGICKCFFFPRNDARKKGCKKSKCSNSPVGLSF